MASASTSAAIKTLSQHHRRCTPAAACTAATTFAAFLFPSRTSTSSSSIVVVPAREIHVPKYMYGRPTPKPKKGERFGRNWRARRGLPNVLDETGPLAELPDWSYVDDGRPAPLSKKQSVKAIEQQRLARDVLSGLAFVKFSESRPQRLAEEAAAKRKAIEDTKLKPKGNRIQE